MSLTNVLKAVEVLAPLVEQVVAHLQGGPKPEFFETLPETMRSEVALKARRARNL